MPLKRYLLFVLFLCIGSAADAQNDEREVYRANGNDDYINKSNEIVVRPGMTLKKVGGLNMLVPEDIEVYKDRGQWKMEEPDAYAARNFKEIKNRLERLEINQERLQNEAEKMRQALLSKPEAEK